MALAVDSQIFSLLGLQSALASHEKVFDDVISQAHLMHGSLLPDALKDPEKFRGTFLEMLASDNPEKFRETLLNMFASENPARVSDEAAEIVRVMNDNFHHIKEGWWDQLKIIEAQIQATFGELRKGLGLHESCQLSLSEVDGATNLVVNRNNGEPFSIPAIEITDRNWERLMSEGHPALMPAVEQTVLRVDLPKLPERSTNPRLSDVVDALEVRTPPPNLPEPPANRPSRWDDPVEVAPNPSLHENAGPRASMPPVPEPHHVELPPPPDLSEGAAKADGFMSRLQQMHWGAKTAMVGGVVAIGAAIGYWAFSHKKEQQDRNIQQVRGK